MTYATTDILVRHTGHNRATIRRALKRTNTPVERLAGNLGNRVKESDANKMIAKMWPTIRPLRVAEYQQPAADILTRIESNTEK